MCENVVRSYHLALADIWNVTFARSGNSLRTSTKWTIRDDATSHRCKMGTFHKFSLGNVRNVKFYPLSPESDRFVYEQVITLYRDVTLNNNLK